MLQQELGQQFRIKLQQELKVFLRGGKTPEISIFIEAILDG